MAGHLYFSAFPAAAKQDFLPISDGIYFMYMELFYFVLNRVKIISFFEIFFHTL